MSTPYGEGVKGQFFGFIHEVCKTEMGTTLRQNRKTSWFGRPEIFGGFIALHYLELKYRAERPGTFLVRRFELWLDDGDTQIDVARKTPGDLSDDPLADYMLEQAKELFYGHDHTICEELAPPAELEGTKLTRFGRAGDQFVA